MLLCPVGATASGAQDFYAPPSPLPAGEPGDVLRAEPMVAWEAGMTARIPGRAWRVLYRSTAATGEAIAVSGTVLVPPGPDQAGRPIIGYSVGTRGIADRCAPSRQLAVGGEPEGDAIRDMLGRGWAVALTDWQGFGTPGDHTYVVGRAEGHAVLDAVRAARRLRDADLGDDGPVGVLGYSQGGHSTAWAGQVQPGYAPELRLAGVAAGATPSDLEKVADNLEGGYAAGLVLYASVGMNAAYPELALESYLNDAGRDAVRRIRDSCVLDGSLAFFSFRRSTEFTTTDVRRLPDWQRRLEENDVGAIPPRAPVLLYHARGDELVPYALSEALRARWCARGVNVRLTDLPGVDHTVTGSSSGAPIAMDWMAQRFADGPPEQPAECPAADRVTLRFGFPGGGWRHVTRRTWHVHARPIGGTLERVTFTVRDLRGRIAGRSRPVTLARARHIQIRLRRRVERGERYRIAAAAERPDGSGLRKSALVRAVRRR